MRRWVTFAVLLTLCATAGVPSSAASESGTIDDAGWWSRTNQSPVGAVAPPDIAEEQLLVEGTPEGATALAAFRATLPSGATAPVLTVSPVSSTGLDDSTIFLACQAGSGWTGVEGGGWDDKPAPDCAESVQGVVDDDGVVTFALAPLQFGEQLDVVLVPGRDPNGIDGLDGSAFRVVFDRPSPASLTFTATSSTFEENSAAALAPPSTQYTPTQSRPAATPTPSPMASPPSPSASPAFVPPPTTEADLATQPAIAALPAEEQGQTATAPILSAATPPAPDPLAAASASGDNGRILGLVMVVSSIAGLFLASRRAASEGLGLEHVAVVGGSAAAVAPVVPRARPPLFGRPAGPQPGGIGRFRRVRETPARRLGA